MPFFRRKTEEPEKRADETTEEPEKRADETTEELTPEVSADILRVLFSTTTVTRDMAMSIPAFAACVNKITETFSSVPIKLYRKTNDGDDVEEVKDDDRTRLINDDTGDTLDGVDFKRSIARDYLLGKGGYAYIDRRGRRYRALRYVDERAVSFLTNADPIFKAYDIQVNGVEYKPYQFLKVLRNTENGWSGRSVIQDSPKALSVAYNTMLLDDSLAQTGGSKRGFISSERPLDEAAMDKLKEAWHNMYAANSDETVVILNKGLSFQDASSTSTELQLNENKKTNSDDICKLFGIPASIISGTASDEDVIIFIQYCINPILNAFCCALNRDLLLENEKGTMYFEADTKEFTKGDIDKRFNAYSTGIKNGFMQIDEVRRMENLPPLGIDFVKFGLQDVFYDKDTQTFYTPNMNQSGKMGQNDPADEDSGEGEKGGEGDESRDQG